MRVSRGTLLAGIGATVLLPRTAFAQSADHVNVGTPGQLGNAGVYFAQDMGFFKKADVTADITTLRRGSGAGVVAAVTGGSLDIGEADLVSIAAARQHGIKITLLAPSAVWINTSPTAGIVVAKTSTINGAKEFAGKTIAVPSLEGLSRISANAWLENGGCDLAGVKFVEVPSGSMSQAVAKGTVDGAVLTEPTLSLSVADGNRIVAAPYDAIAKRFIETAWFTSEAFVAKNPQAATKFAVAIRDAQRWANANQAQAAAIYEKYSATTADSMKNTVRQMYGDVLVPAQMQPLLDAGVKYHAIPQPIAAKDMISPVVAALPK